MPNLAEGVRVTLVPAELTAAFLIEPPGWTRLEPQSVSGDPTPGMEARIHDPLWLLAEDRYRSKIPARHIERVGKRASAIKGIAAFGDGPLRRRNYPHHHRTRRAANHVACVR